MSILACSDKCKMRCAENLLNKSNDLVDMKRRTVIKERKTIAPKAIYLFIAEHQCLLYYVVLVVRTMYIALTKAHLVMTIAQCRDWIHGKQRNVRRRINRTNVRSIKHWGLNLRNTSAPVYSSRQLASIGQSEFRQNIDRPLCTLYLNELL